MMVDGENDFICEGPATKNVLEEILRAYFNAKSTLANCHGVVVSKDAGFTSEVIRVKLEWNYLEQNNNADEMLPKKVVIKVPLLKCMNKNAGNFVQLRSNEAADGDAQKLRHWVLKDSMLEMIHSIECQAYRILHADPSNGQPPPIPIPLIYGLRENHPRLIVMEDLADRASIINIATGLDLNRWRQVVINLAHLHAWSLTTDVQWRSGIPSVDAMPEGWQRFLLDMLRKSLNSVMQKYPDHFGHVDKDLFAKEINFENLVRNEKLYRTVLPDVMQHGDTWVNNMMFERDSKNPDQLTHNVAAFFDWQMCTRGCGINDVAKVTSLCVPHKLRRKYQKDVLKTYFDEFSYKCGAVLDAGVTFDRVWNVFSHAFAFTSLLWLPVVDFTIAGLAKADSDENCWRKNELLDRTKANYDDAAEYYHLSKYQKT